MLPKGAKASDKSVPDEFSLNVEKTDDPLKFLLDTMNDPLADPSLRVRAAVCAAQYTKTKIKDGGKKDLAAGKTADATATPRFAPAAPPRLVAGGH